MGFLGHFDKCHECKEIPSMRIWDLMTKMIRKNPDARVGDLLWNFGGYVCPICGFVDPKASSVNCHIRTKHKRQDTEAEHCEILPQVRPGEGEGEDRGETGEGTNHMDEGKCRRVRQTVESRTRAEVGKRSPRETHLTKEAKYIRKEGSFPKFIKDHICPLWNHFK
jgi:hypothetical protein